MELTHPIIDKDKIYQIGKYLYTKNIRDYMLFSIGVTLGVKITEFTKQKVEYYRQACKIGYIEITSSKNQKENMLIKVKIPDELIKDISNYIKNKADTDYMFPSRKGGKPITRQQLYRILTDAAQSVGIQDSITCLSIRKTFGYWYYKDTEDIEKLKKLFNHTTIEDTLKYIESELIYHE